jgi:hypothetical protein
MRKCIDDFNSCLKDFFEECEPTQMSEAVEWLSDQISTKARKYRSRSARAEAVMLKVVSEAQKASIKWSYKKHIAEYHRRGRSLARLFFRKSTSTELKERLNLKAKVDFKYGAPDPAAPVREWAEETAVVINSDELSFRAKEAIIKIERQARENFNYRAAHFTTHYEDGSPIITVYFDQDNDLSLYWSYPYLFLHEYTAHIFAYDHPDNNFFNDGWLLLAASQFLITWWSAKRSPSHLKFEQVEAFQTHLAPNLGEEARDAYRSAKIMYWWFREWDKTRFEILINELAAFRPSDERSPSWVCDFLRALERAHTLNRKELRDQIVKAGHVSGKGIDMAALFDLLPKEYLSLEEVIKNKKRGKHTVQKGTRARRARKKSR